MPEAEVTLRLALYLIRRGIATGDVSAAIDGAQIRTGERVHFDIGTFLREEGLTPRSDAPGWRGPYALKGHTNGLRIHSTPGQGDVVCPILAGRTLRVECKKGPLKRSASSQEYPLLHEAIGQLMTIEQTSESDVLAVAVPASRKFRELAGRWRQAPLMRRLDLRILLVGQNGNVEGLE